MFDLPFAVPHDSDYEQLSISPDATIQEVVEAKLRHIKRLQTRQRELSRSITAAMADAGGNRERAAARHPIERWEAELRAHNQREQEINALPLHNPEGRSTYDRANPPFEILRIDASVQDLPWSDAAQVVAQVRADVAQFVTEHGEAVFHPSDLTRSDFSADCVWCESLDGEGAR
jgi:hypothetical protein